MAQVYKPLAELEFAKVLSEANSQTQMGASILNKYRQFLSVNEASCTLVNHFLKEAAEAQYDNELKKVYEYVAAEVSKNRIGWSLASVCEAIEHGSNQLNQRAAKQVRELLEKNEADIVNNIRAGALKSAMFVESIHNVVNQVYAEQPIIMEKENITYKSANNNIYKPLADLEFANVLAESVSQTQTGANLINKYRSYLLTNEATCTLVNNFLAEAQQCLYDNGVKIAAEYLASQINESKTSWRLASACESILANKSQYNYLNRNAVKQVEKLLEMKESDVVSYIKAGALKNVMFCEAFRNIVKDVYKETPMQFEAANYKSTTPISMVESNNETVYFQVLGNIYAVENKIIRSANANEVSNDFIVINQLLESNICEMKDNAFIITTEHAKYIVEKQGECTREGKDQTLKLSTEQLREHNNLFLSARTRKNNAFVLEAIAKLTENFDNVMALDNAQVITSGNDKFLVIENETNVYAILLESNHSQKWEINESVIEAVQYIKKQTKIDLTEHFENKIESVVETRTAEEQKAIKESMQKNEVDATKAQIAVLTEKYKNDPVRLAMLSKLASQVAEL